MKDSSYQPGAESIILPGPDKIMDLGAAHASREQHLTSAGRTCRPANHISELNGGTCQLQAAQNMSGAAPIANGDTDRLKGNESQVRAALFSSSGGYV